MLIDVSKNTIVKAAPTALDSLKHSMAQLQVKVDSLQKITERAEIGREFFSDAISTNLYMFATIIGLAALVSWGVIGGMLLLHKRKVKNQALQAINAHVDIFTHKFNDLEEKSLETVFDVNRAMYFACEQNENKFEWALATAVASYQYNSDNKEIIFVWVESILEILEKLEPGNIKITEHIDYYEKELDKIIILDDDTEELKDIYKKVKKLMLHIAHTIPTPPDNLMEGPGFKINTSTPIT